MTDWLSIGFAGLCLVAAAIIALATPLPYVAAVPLIGAGGFFWMASAPDRKGGIPDDCC